ncbi:MAG: HAD-IC family P-type ATPase, partial [Armatimonadetes bacterium]|nr:HAD-IC family P-type ATPase [Armatimonadota bacterium]
MTIAAVEQPRCVHAVPGRVRVHVPGWTGSWTGQREIEARLRQMPGVQSVQASPLTGNALVQFDPRRISESTILSALRGLEPALAHAAEEEPRPAPPPVVHEKAGPGRRRARIAVRGLDRDPHLARRVVTHLEGFPGVRARASALTGRVLVEYDAHWTDIEELLTQVTEIELPPDPGEDRPAHPLDPAPLVQSASRTAAAGAGLGLIAARRLAGADLAIVSPTAPAYVSGVFGLIHGIPSLRNGLRSLLGRSLADLLLSVPDLVALALSGNVLGLAVTGGGALRLLTEVTARRAAWRRYEERIGPTASAEPGATIRLEAGERTPLGARVVEGAGTAIGRDGLPRPVVPGGRVEAGARLAGGPFMLELIAGPAFTPVDRPAPPAPTLYDRYQRLTGLLSLAYAAVTGLITRSPARVFEALLLVNPRTATIGAEAANVGASARALRAGVTVVGTRPERFVRRPDLLLVDGPRVLTNGVELTGALPFNETCESADIIAMASGVAAAAGSPWGTAFPPAGAAPATEGTFDGETARASLGGDRYSLRAARDGDGPEADGHRRRGDYVLILQREGDFAPAGLLTLRPRLASGVAEMVATCRRDGVTLRMLPGGDEGAAYAVARRAGVPIVGGDAMAVIRAAQVQGARVALLSDTAEAGEAFAACDLAIGLTSGRSGRFPARADLLAPDLGAVAAIVESGARRETTIRDSVLLSVGANIFGAVWGFRGRPGVERASRAVYVTALAALADGWARLRGGERSYSVAARLADPRPERWGARTVEQTLAALKSSPRGLTTAQAAARRRLPPPAARRNAFLSAIVEQLSSPLTGILAVGAGLSLFLGHPLDFVLIAATVVVNVAVGVYQEHQAGRAAEALARLGSATATVLRDGQPMSVPAALVVPGDVLILTPGERVDADARLLESQGLEVDEAALTGESLPVPKAPDGGTDASRIVLEGSDVTVGTGRAVVFAVGAQTRLGVTAAALALDENEQSPLGRRLSRLLSQFLPLSLVGGGVVFGAGVLRGASLLPQLGVAATIALAAVPEGLPLLAGMGESSVARRLAGRRALVRRLGAVEALGRVDIACTDKTGTLTEGRLALSLVAASDGEEAPPAPSSGGAGGDRTGSSLTPPGLGAGGLSEALRHVLLTAALASPHPDAPDAASHPTDVAVVQGAQRAGLDAQVRAERQAEEAFDPARGFHASLVDGRLCVKGAPEALAPRCARVRREGRDGPLDDAGRQELLTQARRLAERGLRVLMVAENGTDAPPQDPQNLVALGFVGISDPLRATVLAAVRRCREAGVRVIMITGDHPATARAIATQAGLLQDGEEVVTSAEIAELQNGDLARRLESAAVIARATPLDKLRIIESLQGHGHTVAMTGDGVNDAPALRLADVGVAMGRGGTEVARQAADVVLADDDFATLVETFVEGRGFWRNMRRALGLLLGGNLGELGLVVGASALGLSTPLNTRQILAMNLITDALPALSVAVQRPEHRDLSALAREGTAALDAPLRRDVLRRGASTTLPSLAAFALALPMGLPHARTIAFSSVVSTQLAQTLDAGRSEGTLTPAVLGAVGSSGALLLGALTIPPLRDVLTLTTPLPLGWGMIALSTLAALVLARLFPN